MYTLRRMWQTHGTRDGIRILIALVMAIVSIQFYTSVQPSSLFIGMYRLSDDPSMPNLLANVYAIAFIACGLAFALEQPSEYLCVPDYLVYIRQRRGAAHFFRYLTIVVIYALLYTGLQAIVAWWLIPRCDIRELSLSAACAAFMLISLLLMLNVSYLLGNRAWGYFAAAMLYALLLSINPLARWFAFANIMCIPVWVPVLACMIVALSIANLHIFLHLEIQ